MKKFFICIVLVIIVTIPIFSQSTGLNLGAKHNQVVDYLNSYDFTGKNENAFMDDLIYNTGKMFDASAFPEGKDGIWGIIQFCGKADPGPLDTKSYGEIIDLHVSKGNISNSSSEFLKNLETESDKTESYEELKKKLDSLLNSFSYNSLSDLEKTIVLGIFEVFNSSAIYWNNYAAGQSAEERWNWRCILCVAWNDIKGAAIGFMIGNCLCLKLGIPNPAICGAVGAAIVGGLYSWAAKVCPERCKRCKKPDPSSYPSWLCNILLF